MKTGILFSLGLIAGTGLAFSIDRPAEDPNAPQAPELTPMPQTATPLPGKPVRLGFVPAIVPQALVAQLELNGFPGVLVSKVIPDSPASKAGLQENDVVVKLGDVSLSNPGDIVEAMRDKVPGEKITAIYYHKGQRTTVELVLDDETLSSEEILAAQGSDQSPTAQPARAMRRPALSAMPNTHSFSLSIGPNGIRTASGGASQAMAQMQQIMEMMMSNATIDDKMLKSLNLTPGFGSFLHNMQDLSKQSMPRVGSMSGSGFGSSNVHLSDSKGTVSVRTIEGKGTTVRVTDSAGKVLYEGPYNTQAEKDAVPSVVRERLKSVLDNNFCF